MRFPNPALSVREFDYTMKPLQFLPLAAILALSQIPSTQAQESVFRVDPVHSTVLAKILHLNVGNSYARFNEIDGTIKINESNPESSSLDFTIKADSVDTNNEKRDQHLKGPDFFNAKQFPVITFKSTSVKKVDDKEFEVTGDLTLKGVTKPVTVELDFIGRGKGMQGEERAGGEATFKIKRSDFGMDYMQGPLGDEVDIIVSVEGIKEG